MSYQTAIDCLLRQRHQEYSRRKQAQDCSNIHQIKFYAYCLFDDWFYATQRPVWGGMTHAAPLPFTQARSRREYLIKVAVYKVYQNKSETICVAVRVKDELDKESNGWHHVKVEDDYVHILNQDAEYVIRLKDLKLCRKSDQIIEPQELKGNKLASSNAAVLGGIEGVKLRLNSSDVRYRMEVLNEALKYGESGIDLIIQTGIEDESCIVWYGAFKLLKAIEPKSEKIVEALNKIGIRFFN